MPSGRPPSQPLRAIPALSATATVGLFDVGPQPIASPTSGGARSNAERCGGTIDAEGNVYASVYLALEARAALTGVALAELELLDDNRALVARGTATEMRLMTDPPARDLGRFDGTVTAGSRVVVWTGARLDAPVDRLLAAHPTHYRLRLAADRGVVQELSGAIEPPRATASPSGTPPRP